MFKLAAERREIQLTAPSGIAAGGTAVFKLPQGLRYHDLYLEYGGTLATNYGEIRIKANTEIIHRYDATERDMMNETDGLAAADGVLTIPLDGRAMRSREGEEETALNVGRPAGVEPQPNEIISAELHVDIKAGATGESLKLRATVSNALPGGAGLVRHIVRTTRSAGGAGEFDINDLDYNRPNRAMIRRFFLKTTALDTITIERDNRKIFERSKALNDLVLADGGYRSQQTGWTLIDKSEMGYAGSVIHTAGAQDFLLRLNMTGAASFPILTEYLGGLVG